ncbi:unnamed protein product [Caenorhabditis auriculariae]|uniref:Uncharacterized protein n=1 Tax=Caenorhabditis auriculariae TaxID=2777116 RepID=A0A8S1HM74_9PELO|nr:unnamed protein product [Caenorhabditis auriculariae]
MLSPFQFYIRESNYCCRVLPIFSIPFSLHPATPSMDNSTDPFALEQLGYIHLFYIPVLFAIVLNVWMLWDYAKSPEKNMVAKLMIALLVAGLLLQAKTIFVKIAHFLFFGHEKARYFYLTYMLTYGNPIFTMGQTACALIHSFNAFQEYISVISSEKSKSLGRHINPILFGIAFAAFSTNFLRFFAHKVHYSNGEVRSEEWLNKNRFINTYVYGWMSLFINVVFPLTVVVVFKWLTKKKLLADERDRQCMGVPRGAREILTKRTKESLLYIRGVVIMFFIGTLLYAFVKVISIVDSDFLRKNSPITRYCTFFGDWFLLLQTSTPFIMINIHCFFSSLYQLVLAN